MQLRVTEIIATHEEMPTPVPHESPEGFVGRLMTKDGLILTWGSEPDGGPDHVRRLVIRLSTDQYSFVEMSYFPNPDFWHRDFTSPASEEHRQLWRSLPKDLQEWLGIGLTLFGEAREATVALEWLDVILRSFITYKAKVA